jgi:hypothetical protein
MGDFDRAVMGSADDPAKPEGVQPLGQVDARFAVSFENSVPAALLVMSQLFSALARRDAKGLQQVLHFPFASYEGTEPEVVESFEQLATRPPKSLNLGGEGKSHIQPGSYDILEGIEIHTYNCVSAGCSMSYSRFGPDGHLALRSEGIYAITNNDGKWAVELMSTIFTPAAAIGVRYPEAEQAALRRGREWMLGYTLRDQALLNSTHQYGKRANVATNNPRVNAGNARGGDPMGGFKIKGVRSRLRITETTPESAARGDANFAQFAEWAGGGVGAWDYTISRPDARVLHATVDKVHTVGGYIRYTADSRPISETRSLGITTYRNGRWGGAGGAAQMMVHDLTNSLRA